MTHRQRGLRPRPGPDRGVAFVVMAGGKGERLWPLVRANRPKVCLPLGGASNLLKATVKRLRPLSRRPITVVITSSQERPVRRALGSMRGVRILAEPTGRGTAACIALAAAAIARDDPSTVLAVLPADHWVQPVQAFQRALRAAIDVAHERDWLVTVGVRPTRVHPGLGYLCVGRPMGRRRGCRTFELKQFIEKPSPTLAARLLSRGGGSWNAGIFVGRVEVFLRALERWMPALTRRVVPLAAHIGRPGFPQRAAAAYRGLKSISFDDGVMAHLREGCVVEGRFAWEDLGSWESWVRMHRAGSPLLAVGSRNVRVVAEDRHLVAVIGVDDLIVVRTEDATLICRSGESQRVREITNQLARDARLGKYR